MLLNRCTGLSYHGGPWFNPRAGDRSMAGFGPARGGPGGLATIAAFEQAIPRPGQERTAVSPKVFFRAASQLGEFDHNDRIIPERWALA